MSTISNSSEIREQSDNMTVHIRQTYHDGVLPPPEQLEKYALAHPDAVKTILEMATRQLQMDFEIQKNQQERFTLIDRGNFDLANKRVEMNGRYARQGQWLAFSMMLCFFVLLGYMATVTGSSAVAVGFIVPAIAAIGHIVYLFLHGKKPPKPPDDR
jgi:uncharacterized membrane protein